MIYAIVVVLALILDQALKLWTNRNLAVGEVKELIPGVIELFHTQNKGSAFGFLQDVEAARWIFIALVIVFSIAVIYVLSQNMIKSKFGRMMLALIMAGGLGNGIDRMVNGYVVDMFNFEFVEFAVFNIADIFLTVCGIMFCAWLIFHKPEEKKPSAQRGVRRRAVQGPREVPNDDYITQLKKPVAHARAQLEQPKTAARPEASPKPQQSRPQQPRPRQPVSASDDPFAEFASASESAGRDGSARQARSSSKKISSDYSLDDILAEFSDK